MSAFFRWVGFQPLVTHQPTSFPLRCLPSSNGQLSAAPHLYTHYPSFVDPNFDRPPPQRYRGSSTPCVPSSTRPPRYSQPAGPRPRSWCPIPSASRFLLSTNSPFSRLLIAGSLFFSVSGQIARSKHCQVEVSLDRSDDITPNRSRSQSPRLHLYTRAQPDSITHYISPSNLSSTSGLQLTNIYIQLLHRVENIIVMALPPIVSATLQSAALSGTSNLLAQALTAYQTDV